MKGLIRPCRHRLGPELQERWRAHLCGLCLTLRDDAGQSARVLTGYDALLLSVLVEAQAGRQPTRTAGRCALRGMQTAEVVRADTPAMQLAAAGTLLTGSAGLRDKLTDRDLPYGTRAVAGLAASRYEAKGGAMAGRIGLETTVLLAAPAAAAAAESRADATLDELLAPTGAVVAALFAHTALTAGRPDNAEALRRAGDAYGRLVHLLDAVTDLDDDLRHGAFNPLAATATSDAAAKDLARALSREVACAVDEAGMADPDLARLLLGPELGRAVSRTWKSGRSGSPQLALTGAIAALSTLSLAKRRRGPGERAAGDCCFAFDFCPCDCCECCACCEGIECCGDCGCDACECCC